MRLSTGTIERIRDLSVSNNVRRMLESEAGSFLIRFPGLNIRFCGIMGRRISHIAGDTSFIRGEEFRVDITPELVMFVCGYWQDIEDELKDYAQSIAKQISS